MAMACVRGCWRRGGLAASGTLAPPGIKLSGCMWLPCAEESFLEALGAPDSGSTRALHVAPRRGRGFCHQVQKADAASLPPAMLDHEPRRLVPPSPGEATTLFNSGRSETKAQANGASVVVFSWSGGHFSSGLGRWWLLPLPSPMAAGCCLPEGSPRRRRMPQEASAGGHSSPVLLPFQTFNRFFDLHDNAFWGKARHHFVVFILTIQSV